MNWVMILLMFDVHTGQLMTHTEQLYSTQKQCDDAGYHSTVNVEPPEGLQASYICMSRDALFPPAPTEEKKSRGIHLFG